MKKFLNILIYCFKYYASAGKIEAEIYHLASHSFVNFNQNKKS